MATTRRTGLAAALTVPVALAALAVFTSGSAGAQAEPPAAGAALRAGSPLNLPVTTTTVAAPPAATTPETPPETTAPPAPAPAAADAEAPMPTLPSNVEPISWTSEPLQAVGSRSGPATAAIQQRLLDLGFWNSAPDGQYGFTTTQAVMAFQKYAGLSATGSVDRETAFKLTVFFERAHGQSNAGTLVEIDKARQLLFLIVDGRTVWAFNTSTGSGIPYEEINEKDPTKIEKGDAQTPDGLFKTNRERPDGWWEGDLGKIYRPKYFIGGIAVHGMTNIPNRPVSHGCVRLSTQAMDFIWDNNLIPLKTPVWVHS